jgi:hypothetical protein
VDEKDGAEERVFGGGEEREREREEDRVGAEGALFGCYGGGK